MPETPACPKCASEYAHEMGSLLVCPECAHEWSPEESQPEPQKIIRDAVGNILSDGDTVTIVKDLKVKGSKLAKNRAAIVKKFLTKRGFASTVSLKPNGKGKKVKNNQRFAKIVISYDSSTCK